LSYGSARAVILPEDNDSGDDDKRQEKVCTEPMANTNENAEEWESKSGGELA